MHAEGDAEVPLRLGSVAVVGIEAYGCEGEAVHDGGFAEEIDAFEVIAVVGCVVVVFVDGTPRGEAVELGAELQRRCYFPNG